MLPKQAEPVHIEPSSGVFALSPNNCLERAKGDLGRVWTARFLLCLSKILFLRPVWQERVCIHVALLVLCPCVVLWVFNIWRFTFEYFCKALALRATCLSSSWLCLDSGHFFNRIISGFLTWCVKRYATRDQITPGGSHKTVSTRTSMTSIVQLSNHKQTKNTS